MFKVGDKVRVAKDWAGEAKTGMVGTVRRIFDYGPDRIGVDFGENATTEMHTLDGALRGDTGWYIPEDHLELIPREIKPCPWCQREPHVSDCGMPENKDGLYAWCLTDGCANQQKVYKLTAWNRRATHVWVSDPVKTPVTLEIGSPLVKALDELSDTHPGDEFELRHVRAVMTEWRAIKAKMGVK